MGRMIAMEAAVSVSDPPQERRRLRLKHAVLALYLLQTKISPSYPLI